jgi:hypothetical protein
MDAFDRLLEFELRKMLDPVVGQQAPRRHRRKSTGSPLAAVISAPAEMAVDALPAVEPVVEPVAVPVVRVVP